MENAADEGVLLHSAMEHLVKWYVTPGNGEDVEKELDSLALPPGAKFAVLTAWRAVKDDLSLFIGGHVFTEYEIKPGVTTRGFIDLLLVSESGTYAHVEDYKMVRVKGNHKYQLYSYALGVFEAFPQVERVCCVINAPRLVDVEREPMVLSRGEIPRITEELVELQLRAANPFSPPTPCDVCTSCKWNGRCPGQQKMAVAAAEAIGYPMIRQVLQAPSTPEQYALRRYVVDALRQFAEKVREEDNAESERTGIIPPGYTRITRQSAAGLKPGQEREVFDTLLGKCGVPIEILHAYANVDLKKLSVAMSELTGDNPREVLKGFYTQLKDLYDEPGSFSYLQKTSRKPLAELFAAVAGTTKEGESNVPIVHQLS